MPDVENRLVGGGGHTELVGLTHTHCHVRNSWLAGGCCRAQGAPLGAPKGSRGRDGGWGWGMEARRGGAICILRADSRC